MRRTTRKSARTLNEGRSLNPGDTYSRVILEASAEPLNEGRSLNPGDTRVMAPDHLRLEPRSTKAGV